LLPALVALHFNRYLAEDHTQRLELTVVYRPVEHRESVEIITSQGI